MTPLPPNTPRTPSSRPMRRAIVRPALACLVVLALMLVAACSRDLPTGARGVPMSLRIALAPDAPRGSLPASTDSLQIRVYDASGVEDVLVASTTVFTDTSTAEFDASFDVPYAIRYKVSATVFGVQARGTDPFVVTGYGIQFYGERVVDAGLGGLGDVRIDLRDVVPFASRDATRGLHWAPIPYAVTYDIFDLQFGGHIVQPDTSIQIATGLYQLSANLYNGLTSAGSEYVP